MPGRFISSQDKRRHILAGNFARACGFGGLVEDDEGLALHGLSPEKTVYLALQTVIRVTSCVNLSDPARTSRTFWYRWHSHANGISDSIYATCIYTFSSNIFHVGAITLDAEFLPRHIRPRAFIRRHNTRLDSCNFGIQRQVPLNCKLRH
ncbi:hypothetical protein D9M68_705000 [compost metagenome]